jgi:hypothetical protein
MLVADFNFYRSIDNRNRDGVNMQDIFTFNQIISNLGLQEIPSKEETIHGATCSSSPFWSSWIGVLPHQIGAKYLNGLEQ